MSKYDEATVYLVSVLFCHGASETEIAKVLHDNRIALLTKGKVSGIVNRAGGGQLRNLNKVGRQAWLDLAKQFRSKNDPSGRLRDDHFLAKERR